jgi:putative ABC transport system ATP-binding protein
MSLIEIQNLNKVYNTTSIPVQAIKNVSLKIDQKEFTAIVGPSGSGKTTLLNIMGGLDKPTDGRILIDDLEITALSSGKLTEFRLNKIGFVFQAYNLIPVFTARENVEFIMLLQGIDKEERTRRAQQLLEAVGLKERLDSMPAQLSGGQQQRVAIARALASHPAFVLADEPTANLDSVSAENLLDIMESLNQNNNMTFVFSTHDQKVINRAHRVIVLEDGTVKEDKNA